VYKKTKGNKMAQTKKTAKKTVKKTAPKAAPKAVATPAAAAASSSGKKHGACWKKILIFALGVVVGCGACCLLKCHKKKMFGRKFGPMNEAFVNGCLDLSKIDCPEKLEKVQLKDADKDGCITKEEIFGGDRPAAPQRKLRRPRGQRTGR
jgi:hypothetical protein